MVNHIYFNFEKNPVLISPPNLHWARFWEDRSVMIPYTLNENGYHLPEDYIGKRLSYTVEADFVSVDDGQNVNTLLSYCQHIIQFSLDNLKPSIPTDPLPKKDVSGWETTSVPFTPQEADYYIGQDADYNRFATVFAAEGRVDS